VDDDHLLALGRAVHTFQKLEWLAIWINTLVSEDGDIRRFDGLPFGRLVRELEKRLHADESAGEPVRAGVKNWARDLGPANVLRQDVFHSYPVREDEVLRLRQDGQLIQIHKDRLDAAAHRFEASVREGTKLFEMLWPRALGRPSFEVG
jgi:hypothetical protein